MIQGCDEEEHKEEDGKNRARSNVPNAGENSLLPDYLLESLHISGTLCNHNIECL